MTSYLLRVDDKRALPTSPNVRVLDWHPGRPEATIQTGRDWRYFLAGQTPSKAAAQAMLLGAAVYCADKTSLRADSIDAWTRDITVRTPVADPTPWGAAEWHRPLNFLSGDRWIVTGYESKTPAERTMTVMTDEVDPPGFGEDTVVCLFSGGLDSLSGAIDLLAERDDRRVVLVGHHEGGQAATAQEDLYRRLDHAYPGRLELRQLFLRPAPARPEQARPLPKGSENTQRSRSLLFITAGLMVASTYGPDTPLYVPENGFIGINVPLTRARAGSLSTRTTHPHFFRLLGDALTAAGVTNPIVNPYRLRTKGEILAGSLDPDLLSALAPRSVSCAHPEAARWEKGKQGNCGYCFPCLIRRASMAHVGFDDGRAYFKDALTDPTLLNPDSKKSADLRGVVNSLNRRRPDRDAISNGPLPSGERQAYVDMWRRGLDELRAWLSDASGPLARLVP